MAARPSPRPRNERLLRTAFLFSNAEIATAATRQRYVDTAVSLLKNTKDRHLHGTLAVGCGDSFLEKLADNRPLSQAERTKINSVPPETRILRRLTLPEEFGIRCPEDIV